jgi:hypothetical protein
MVSYKAKRTNTLFVYIVNFYQWCLSTENEFIRYLRENVYYITDLFLSLYYKLPLLYTFQHHNNVNIFNNSIKEVCIMINKFIHDHIHIIAFYKYDFC